MQQVRGKNIWFTSFLGLLGFFVSLSFFVWGFAASQFKIFPYNLFSEAISQGSEREKQELYESDSFWAEEIIRGGTYFTLGTRKEKNGMM